MVSIQNRFFRMKRITDFNLYLNEKSEMNEQTRLLRPLSEDTLYFTLMVFHNNLINPEYIFYTKSNKNKN